MSATSSDTSTSTTTSTTISDSKRELKSDNAKKNLKEDLSRMEGTYGKEVIGKLKKLKVCLIGLRGVGIETAKNLILAGPDLVDVHDDAKCEIADLGCNFYLTQDDIERGTSRAQACLGKLQELNPNVEVKQHSGHFEPAHLDKYDVVVCCDDRLPEQALKDFNDHCRNHKPKPIVFMVAHIQGATGSVFTDFGPSHTIIDEDGEPTKTLIIDSILNDQATARVTIDGERHGLYNGDRVRFSEVKMKGSKDLGDPVTYMADDTIVDINQTHVVKTTRNPKVFTIGSTKGLGEYVGGGIAQQIKVPKTVSFNSFEDELKCPTIIDSYMDFTKLDGRAQQLHFGRLALYEFLAKHDRIPNYHSEEDSKQVIELANEINEKHKKLNEKPDGKRAIVVDQVDEKVIRKLSLYAKCEISLMAALFGGILAQEIIKHTGKYSPVKQWLHFDSLEILDEKIPADADPSKMEPSRYEHLIAMFGKAWHEAYMKKNVFVVGCGALGCEYLKMVAMTGLGVKGKVTVTDDDTIELSNLSRQFLFRRRHVNKEKSASAAESVKAMNPELKSTLDAKNIRVEPKTENVFNDKFWDGLDFVINALDNTKARQYIDGKCVLYRKPLFESGTLGTKANNVVCLPDKSPSYSEGVNSGEGQGIAKCTLRNFPSLILHCIEWAREMFDDWFIEGPDCAAKFIKDQAGYLASLKTTPLEELSKLRMVKKWVGLAINPSVEKCAEEAYKLFLACFRNGILDLIHNFPEDSRMTDKDTGADLGPFWHGHKRFPMSCEWDPTNDKYVSFIYHATNIFVNQVFDLKTPVDMADIKKIVTSFEVTEWKYSGATVDLDEDEKDGDEKEEVKELDDEDRKEIDALTTELKAVEIKTVSALQAADFEKDDDKNHHIDIIASSTNLRAYNYRIQETTAAHCRMIAGKIIPAIATTTACITGFVGLEVLKRCRNAELEAYRMVTINLAVNNISMELLPDPKKKKSGMDPETYMEMKAVPEGYTTWDCIEIKEPDLTLAAFLETFKKVHHNCTITMLGDKESGKVYYNDVNKKNDVQMPRKLIDIVTEINKGPIFPEDRNYVVFDSVMVETADQEEGQTPKIKYYFR